MSFVEDFDDYFAANERRWHCSQFDYKEIAAACYYVNEVPLNNALTILVELAPPGADTVVIWPYDDCALFTEGDVVWYSSQLSMGFSRQMFWNPKTCEWLPSIRPNILKDSLTCLTMTPTLNTPT